VIEVVDLQKSFGSVQAVRGVRFEARDGEVTGLLGPNGAGKTTTLRMLYGLISADAGEVRVDGIDVMRDPLDARAHMGVLPDAQGLYPRLSAREHIRYFGELQGLRGETLGRRVDELVAALDMQGIADRRAAGFSQGERMKVALARALVHEPQNVLLDEPTNGLDVMSTRAMRAQIQGLRTAGKCVLFSSHIMQEVSALCDRVIIIAHGKVVASGSPDELRERAGIADLEEVFVRLAGIETGGSEGGEKALPGSAEPAREDS
jgi:sodium transport system ATP-binding protein